MTNHHSDISDHNIAGRVARMFTYNKPLSLLAVLGIVVAGVTTYMFTPKQYNPEIERPAFRISVPYQGARADEVELFLSSELVENMRDIKGVDEVSSVSSDGGLSTVTVIFDVGEKLEDAKLDVLTRLNESSVFSYAGVGEPVISVIDPDMVPIVSIVFTSDVLSPGALRVKVARIMEKIKRVPDVADIKIFGGMKESIRVVLSPERMTARSVSIDDVLRALKSANVRTVTDGFGDGERLVGVTIDGTFTDSASVRDLPVRKGVRVGDVASVYRGYEEKESATLFATRTEGGYAIDDAVYLSIAKRENAGAPEVAQDIIAALEKEVVLESYGDMSYEIVRNDGRIAEEAIGGLALNLLTSIVIVGIVLFLFLSARPALVVMAAIPSTLLLVFVIGFFADQTINRITLFALILSLGLLVDSATVVVENIHRTLEEKKGDSKGAIVQAVHQVGVGLILSTLTSVVVFLPVNYITGMMGPYMGPIAFFVPIALISALFVAFVVTPFLSSIILRTHKFQPTHIKGTERIFKRLETWYVRKLTVLMYDTQKASRALRLSVVLLLIAIVLPVVGIVHFQMLPKADKEQFFIYIDMPEGTDIEATDVQTQAVAQYVFDDPETVSIQMYVGEAPIVDFNGLFKGASLRSSPHMATLKVNITHPDDRNISSSDIVSRIRTRVVSSVKTPSGTMIRFLEDPPGPPVQATFVANIFGDEREVREHLASVMGDSIRGVDGVVDIDTHIESAYPRVVLRVDNDKALHAGVRTSTIAEIIEAGVGPYTVTQYHKEDAAEYYTVTVSLSPEDRDAPDDLDRVYVRSETTNALIPLSSIISVSYSRNIPSIYAEDLRPVTYVTAETDKRSIVYVVIDTIRMLLAYEDERGTITDWNLFGMIYTTENGEIYEISWGGEWEMTLENFRDLGIAMLVALCMVYAVLVAQYRSFRISALVMATVPFGLVGILPGFALLDSVADIHLTATGLIGFIALIGIVVNNAILFLEYVTELKEKKEYEDDRKALIEAGRVRMRPILLTSLTTVLGSLTIAFDPVWSGLAWSIVFGLSLSAVMTLGIFPLLYTRFVSSSSL